MRWSDELQLTLHSLLQQKKIILVHFRSDMIHAAKSTRTKQIFAMRHTSSLENIRLFTQIISRLLYSLFQPWYKLISSTLDQFFLNKVYKSIWLAPTRAENANNKILNIYWFNSLYRSGHVYANGERDEY